jgi:predicted TPR repeat methyltransferase
LAFDCLTKAITLGPGDEENVEPFYFVGASLGRWKAMVEPLTTFVELKPEHSAAWGRLSSIHFNLGEEALARNCAEKSLAIDAKNPVAKSILARLKSGKCLKLDPDEPAIETIDIALKNSGIFDQTAIVW